MVLIFKLPLQIEEKFGKNKVVNRQKDVSFPEDCA